MNYIPIYSALLSAAIAAIVAGTIAVLTGRKNRRQYIDHSVDKMIDIAIAYPYLEDDDFCAAYGTSDKKDEKVMRYDNFCCFVFNTIESAWELCCKDAGKVNSIFYVDELVVRHRVWWASEPENVSGYSPEFRQFVDDILERDRNKQKEKSSPAQRMR